MKSTLASLKRPKSTPDKQHPVPERHILPWHVAGSSFVCVRRVLNLILLYIYIDIIFSPSAPERSAAPILRECSINCWGDPWQQRSSNQPPSLSYSLSHLQAQLTLRQCNRVNRRNHCEQHPLRRFSIKVTDGEPASCPKTAPHQRQVSADRTRTSG